MNIARGLSAVVLIVLFSSFIFASGVVGWYADERNWKFWVAMCYMVTLILVVAFTVGASGS